MCVPVAVAQESWVSSITLLLVDCIQYGSIFNQTRDLGEMLEHILLTIIILITDGMTAWGNAPHVVVNLKLNKTSKP